LLAALTAPQRAAVVERASTALPRTELPRRLSRIWEAPSQTRPRGAAATNAAVLQSPISA
jgi:hypothetical protein